MAPDRGHDRVQDELRPSEDDRSGFNAENRPRTSSTPDEPSAHDAAQQRIAERASQPQNFTVRGVLLGLFIGLIIAFSNTYFGLQTGWVSGMSMPSALIAFAFFKVLGPYLKLPFSPVENVLVQTVAGSVGTMPLGCGFVGVIPALEYLLNKDENGPLDIGVGRLVLWAVGVCLFGVVIAVPLRNEVIIREKLKFPSGTATALMIGVLHGDEKDALAVKQEEPQNTSRARSHDNEQQRLMDQGDERGEQERPRDDPGEGDAQAGMQRTTSRNPAADDSAAWKAKILSLMLAFAGSGIYVGSFQYQILFATTGLHQVPDSRDLLHSPTPQHPHPWCLSSTGMALDAQPVSCVHWPGHHHGSSDDGAYASRRSHWLGHTEPTREE